MKIIRMQVSFEVFEGLFKGEVSDAIANNLPDDAWLFHVEPIPTRRAMDIFFLSALKGDEFLQGTNMQSLPVWKCDEL